MGASTIFTDGSETWHKKGQPLTFDFDSLASSSSISTSPALAAQCMRVWPCPSLRLRAAARCSDVPEHSRLSVSMFLVRTATRSWLAIVAS